MTIEAPRFDPRNAHTIAEGVQEALKDEGLVGREGGAGHGLRPSSSLHLDEATLNSERSELDLMTAHSTGAVSRAAPPREAARVFSPGRDL